MHFLKNAFFIYFPTFRLLPHSLSRNCFTLLKSFFTAFSESVITYITLTVTNILLWYNKIVQSSNNSLPELTFLFRAGLSRLISKLSLISRIYL